MATGNNKNMTPEEQTMQQGIIENMVQRELRRESKRQESSLDDVKGAISAIAQRQGAAQIDLSVALGKMETRLMGIDGKVEEMQEGHTDMLITFGKIDDSINQLERGLGALDSHVDAVHSAQKGTAGELGRIQSQLTDMVPKLGLIEEQIKTLETHNQNRQVLQIEAITQSEAKLQDQLHAHTTHIEQQLHDHTKQLRTEQLQQSDLWQEQQQIQQQTLQNIQTEQQTTQSTLAQQINQVEKQLQEKISQNISNLKENLQKQDKQWTDLLGQTHKNIEGRIANAQQALQAELQKNLQANQKDLQQLQASGKEQQKTIDSKLTQIETTTKANQTRLEAIESKAQSQTAAQQKSLELQDNKIQAGNKTLETISTRIDTLNKNLGDLSKVQKDIEQVQSSLPSTLDHIGTRINALAVDLEQQLKPQLQGLQQEQKQGQDLSRQQLDTLRKAVGEIQNMQEITNTLLDTLPTQINTINLNLSQLGKDLNEVQGSTATAIAEINTFNQSLSGALHARLDQFQENQTEQVERLETIVQHQEEHNERVLDLESSIKEITAPVGTLVAGMDDLDVRLVKSMQAMETRLELIEQQINSIVDKMGHIQADGTRVHAEVQRLPSNVSNTLQRLLWGAGGIALVLLIVVAKVFNVI